MPSEFFLFNRPWESLVNVYPHEEVTHINHAAEEDPRAAGMLPEDVDAIWKATVNLYRTGLHPAIGLCVRRKGHVILDRTIGHARGNAPGASESSPKVLATTDTLFSHFSASKATTAMVVHLLDQQGKIHLDDHVAEYIPGFEKHGKGGITLRHVLTHRAGLPGIPAENISFDLLAKPDQIMQLLCDSKPVWIPGRKMGYHALTGGFILGEVVRRVTGELISSFLKREILVPLGFTGHNYGVAPENEPRVAHHAFTGSTNQGFMLKKIVGISAQELVDFSNTPEFLVHPIPSGNITSTANEASKFYEMLRCEGELGGKRVFEARTVRRAISEQSYMERDMTLMFPVRYSMGFMLGGKKISPYGSETGHAFGHLGLSNVICYADLERETSVAVMTTGKPLLTLWSMYWTDVMNAISERAPRTGNFWGRHAEPS